jgi:mono/diheme cytochrome c family protein
MNRASNARVALFLLITSAIGAAFGTLHARDADEPITTPQALAKMSGEDIYRHICQGCHMADGRGAQGAGTYPALAQNSHLASAQFTAATIYNGRKNMPHFGPQPGLGEFEEFVVVHLDDAEIAAVANYVRSHFGNRYTDQLTAADIAALHPSG